MSSDLFCFRLFNSFKLHYWFLYAELLPFFSFLTKSMLELCLPTLPNKGSILNHKHEDADVTGDKDQSKSIVLYNAPAPSTHDQYYEYYYNQDDHDEEKYPDLRHSLFQDDDELDLGDPNGSVIDLMRNSKEEGEDFKLEDEIDHAADLFILKFHKRMKLQKLESFKRYQEMLQRGT